MKNMELNDLTSALSLLETRRSGRPRELVGPGPINSRGRPDRRVCKSDRADVRSLSFMIFI